MSADLTWSKHIMSVTCKTHQLLGNFFRTFSATSYYGPLHAGIEKKKKEGEKKVLPHVEDRTLAIRPGRTGNLAQVPLHRLFTPFT